MFRLFSIRFCLKSLSCIFLLLIVDNFFFLTFSNEKSIRRDIDPSSPIDRREERSFLRYFQQKKQNIKSSPFKTIVHNTLEKSSHQTSFLIYEYTRHRQLCSKQPSASIYVSTCPFQNCYFTCNASLINRADVILMLYSHSTYQGLASLNRTRNPNQIWLLWHDEPYPPASIYNAFLFNWTLSYRLDSEVSVAAYGITLMRNERMTSSVFEQWIGENYEKRWNEASWFVSNCRSKERVRYYERLKEYFPISAFGKCIINSSENCTHRSQCELHRLSISKFYLAFESTTARLNYITEKFWRSLSLGLIPIVLGPKRRDYQQVAPPNSFIFAEDYQTPETLAKHLHDISTNRKEYEKYHRWRIDYETYYRGDDLEPIRFCELCYRLNTNRDRIWYTDINQYFLETEN